MRRTAAGLAAVAAVLPLVALPGPAAVAAVPGGRVSSVADDECTEEGGGKLINQTPAGLLQLGGKISNTVATGKGVRVAVVDSGVNTKNVHLPPGAVLPGVDISGAGTPNGWTDAAGHGTAVAAIIAGRVVAGSGVKGLAPDATIVPIRVYTQTEEDAEPDVVNYPPTASAISLGIQAAANADAKIINVSLSTPYAETDLANAVSYAARRGALVVASAGNRETSEVKTNTPRYPGAYPDALAVAAVDSTGAVTDDSIHGSYVDVAAPGVDVLTAFRGSGDCLLANEFASTSYATAYVSAAAALIAQAHPDETPAQWRYRLEATALRVRPDTRDDNAGWGIIQPYEALTFVSDGTAVGPQDPAVKAPETPQAVQQQVTPPARAIADTTDRDQTLWLTLGGVVAVLVLALVALLRRDRKKPAPPRRKTPAGVR